MRSLDEARLYLVADGDFSADVLADVIDAGVDVVQLRMKDAEAADVLRAGERFVQVCAARDVPLIVNDRPDIALAIGADGVHLGQDDLPPAVARDTLGPRAIIGRSTHSRQDIDRAIAEHQRGESDYIAVGPVFETPTKPGRAAVGYELVAHAAHEVSFPWFAIGGINASNVGDVVRAGAKRIVVVRAIAKAPDPVLATKELRTALA